MTKSRSNLFGGLARAGLVLGLGVLAIVLSGCRQFEENRVMVSQLHAAGRYDEVAKLLDTPEIKKMYEGKSEVLWELDRGATALALDDTPRAITLLESAERTIEVTRQKSGADVAASWILSDAATTYIAEPYEDLYVNVLKLLAQLEAGRIDGGATVEARRLAGKADQLRDRYVKYADAIRQKDPAALDAASSSGLAAVGTGGQFVESTLGTFLTAITFMKSGDTDLQGVAARRLLDSIRIQGNLLGPVREEDFKALETARTGDLNVAIVALSGRGPVKIAQSIGPIPLGTVPIYFELPQLQTFPSEVRGARLEIDGATSEGAIPLKFVEDLSRVAEANHRQMLPLIYARTYARVAAKAIASAALTESMRRGARDRNQQGVQILGVLAGLAFMGATERADVRAWAMLPGQAHVGTARLSPGTHRVRVVYEGGAGGVLYAGAWQTIEVTERGLTTVVSHYWR